jgi:peptidoglycan hydrolase-like protein with peptidoglycan-binding domain
LAKGAIGDEGYLSDRGSTHLIKGEPIHKPLHEDSGEHALVDYGPWSRGRKRLSILLRRGKMHLSNLRPALSLVMAFLLLVPGSGFGTRRASLSGQAVLAAENASPQLSAQSRPVHPNRHIVHPPSSNFRNTAASAPIISPWPVTRTGKRERPVQSLQYLLRARGYVLDIDGVFGLNTEKAVRAFQESKGLVVDGVVGPQTWAALVFTVRQGSRGNAVRAVQEELQYRNILDKDPNWSLKVDGIFGAVTDSNVRRFQYRVLIGGNDGVVGPITWRALIGGMVGSIPDNAAPLQLNSVCGDRMSNTLLWQVRNPNRFSVPMTWDLLETGQSGTQIVPADGDTSFTSTRTVGPNTARVFIDNQPLLVSTSCLEQPPPDGSRPTMPRTNIEDVAKILYDMVEAGQDLQPALSELFDVIGVRTLRAEEDAEEIKADVQALKPVVLDVQLGAINQEFRSGTTFRLASVLDGFGEEGVTAQSPYSSNGTPIDYSSFTLTIGTVLKQDQVPLGEVLPALVLALGRERARRSAYGITDQVWGDEVLDPLQFTLLLYMFSFVTTEQSNPPLGSSPPSISPPSKPGRRVSGKLYVPGAIGGDLAALADVPDIALDWAKDKIKSKIAEEAKKLVKAWTCAQLLLNYRMTLTASQLMLHRRWLDRPDPPPWESTYKFSASYIGPTQGELVLQWLGCGKDKRPPNGKVIEKPVEWSIVDSPEWKDSISRQGSLEANGEATDQNGEATATFTAFDETTPEPERTIDSQHVAHGIIVARVAPLMEKYHWIELVYRSAGMPLPGEKSLDVIYYAKHRYSMKMQMGGVEESVERELHIFDRGAASYFGVITISAKGEADDQGRIQGWLSSTAHGNSWGHCGNTLSWGPRDFPTYVGGTWESRADGIYIRPDILESGSSTVMHTCGFGDGMLPQEATELTAFGDFKLPDADHPKTRYEQLSIESYLTVELELLPDTP